MGNTTSCATADCHTTVDRSSKYCARHTCRVPNCKAKTKNSLLKQFYCAKHSCKSGNCTKKAHTSHGVLCHYCVDHLCRAPNCGNYIGVGSRYCPRHKPPPRPSSWRRSFIPQIPHPYYGKAHNLLRKDEPRHLKSHPLPPPPPRKDTPAPRKDTPVPPRTPRPKTPRYATQDRRPQHIANQLREQRRCQERMCNNLVHPPGSSGPNEYCYCHSSPYYPNMCQKTTCKNQAELAEPYCYYHGHLAATTDIHPARRDQFRTERTRKVTILDYRILCREAGCGNRADPDSKHCNGHKVDDPYYSVPTCIVPMCKNRAEGIGSACFYHSKQISIKR